LLLDDDDEWPASTEPCNTSTSRPHVGDVQADGRFFEDKKILLQWETTYSREFKVAPLIQKANA